MQPCNISPGRIEDNGSSRWCISEAAAVVFETFAPELGWPCLITVMPAQTAMVRAATPAATKATVVRVRATMGGAPI